MCNSNNLSEHTRNYNLKHINYIKLFLCSITNMKIKSYIFPFYGSSFNDIALSQSTVMGSSRFAVSPLDSFPVAQQPYFRAQATVASSIHNSCINSKYVIQNLIQSQIKLKDVSHQVEHLLLLLLYDNDRIVWLCLSNIITTHGVRTGFIIKMKIKGGI